MDSEKLNLSTENLVTPKRRQLTDNVIVSYDEKTTQPFKSDGIVSKRHDGIRSYGGRSEMQNVYLFFFLIQGFHSAAASVHTTVTYL